MKKFTSILLALIMLFTINTYANGANQIVNPCIVVSVNQTTNILSNGSANVKVKIKKDKN